jgi:hypothetical protein
LDFLSCSFQQRTDSLLLTAEQKAISSLLEEAAEVLLSCSFQQRTDSLLTAEQKAVSSLLEEAAEEVQQTRATRQWFSAPVTTTRS